VDAKAATDERGWCVRRSRVVLTPRCWRQVGGSSPADDGGKRAVHRGEHVISRKTIAQGMSDVLRCPVCSCAHFPCTLRMRPRVQRASGIPCALFLFERAGITCKPRALCAARSRLHIQLSSSATGSAEWPPDDRLVWSCTINVIASEAKQSIAPRKERMDCFVARAPRNDAERARSRIGIIAMRLLHRHSRHSDRRITPIGPRLARTRWAPIRPTSQTEFCS
jgi:hypothetical protein